MEDVDIRLRLKLLLGNVTDNFSNLKLDLKNLSSELAKAAGASNIFNQALDVLKKNPIILVLTTLVTVLAALFSRFKEMDAVSATLGKAFAVLGNIVEKFVVSILTPLIDSFVEIVEMVNNGLIKVLIALGITTEENVQRFGELQQTLDDLEDAEKDAAIAIAEKNLRLQEANEIADDANKPLQLRIDKLREAGKIEKEELDKVVAINKTTLQATLERLAMEWGARDEVIKKIREGTAESLKAARAELLSSKQGTKDKVYATDSMYIEMIKAQEASSKKQAQIEKKITAITKEESDKRLAISKSIADARKKEDEERLKNLEAAMKLIHDAELSLMDKFDADRIKAKEAYNDKLKVLEKAGIEDTMAITREYRNALAAVEVARRADQEKKDLDDEVKRKEKQDKEVERLNAHLAAMNAVMQAKQDEQKALTDAFVAWKEGQAQREIEISSNATGIISEIAGRQSKIGKAFAVANALIGTYSSAQAAFSSQLPPPGVPDPSAPIRAAIAAGVAIASGLLRVKTILAVQTPGGGGVSTSIPGSGSVASAPLSPIPTQTYTTLNPNSIQAVGNAANGGMARAYVVESDIANGQERIERLNRAARIG